MRTRPATIDSVPARPSRGGKYLTFTLGKEVYGLQILKVREIIGYVEVTAVPRTPVYVKGVINLRGQVVPVVDLRAKFGMEPAERTRQTCIVVVETQQGGRRLSTGVVVDHVREVLEIASENIQDAPALDPSVATDVILGMAKAGGSVTILLDIDRALANQAAVPSAAAGPAQDKQLADDVSA